MTAITTIAIILALFLGAAIVIAMRKHYAAERLRLKVKSLNAKIQGYRGSANDCFALYSVKRIDNVECKYHGYWAVCRSSICEGGLYQTCIKVFTDEDDDFNKREAEELCEMLSSK